MHGKLLGVIRLSHRGVVEVDLIRPSPATAVADRKPLAKQGRGRTTWAILLGPPPTWWTYRPLVRSFWFLSLPPWFSLFASVSCFPLPCLDLPRWQYVIWLLGLSLDSRAWGVPPQGCNNCGLTQHADGNVLEKANH